jgi:hypothetical protein
MSSLMQPHSLAALLPHSLTASQPYSLTALLPHSLTASQPLFSPSLCSVPPVYCTESSFISPPPLQFHHVTVHAPFSCLCTVHSNRVESSRVICLTAFTAKCYTVLHSTALPFKATESNDVYRCKSCSSMPTIPGSSHRDISVMCCLCHNMCPPKCQLMKCDNENSSLHCFWPPLLLCIGLLRYRLIV